MQGLKSDWTIGAVNRYSHITTNSRNQKLPARGVGVQEPVSHTAVSPSAGIFVELVVGIKIRPRTGWCCGSTCQSLTTREATTEAMGFWTSSGGLNTR